MDKYATVPVVDVHIDNLEAVWFGLVASIHKASFIALDTEMSGLGDRKKLMTKFVEDRYKFMAEVTKTRAILTLGISCFKRQTTDNDETIAENDSSGQTDTDPNEQMTQNDTDCKKGSSNSSQTARYTVKTFNLSVLCSQEFVVEPGSLQFLIQHGFDFNKQYAKGMPYTRGNDKECQDYSSPSVRNLFSQLVIADKPLVLHNGFFDLMYLYQNFYGDLPDKLEVFVADVHQMFPAGVIDTKYVAEYHTREPASYLGYIFRKCQRYNSSCKASGNGYAEMTLEHDNGFHEWVESLCSYADVKTHGDDGQTLQVCDLFASRGFCNKARCSLSHDMDLILDRDENTPAKKSRRKRKWKASSGNNTEEQAENTSCNVSTDPQANKGSDSPLDKHSSNGEIDSSNMDSGIERTSKPKGPAMSGGHRAGIDAFMTGYCLATYLAQEGHQQIQDYDWSNKISLSGKEMPLSIVSSHFARTSAAHTRKLKLIKGTVPSSD